MNWDAIIEIHVPRRHSTRRNRLRAARQFFNRKDNECWNQPPADCAVENEVRCAAHLADFLDQGGTLKAYSAWSGCSVRELSKQLHSYRRGRLIGQRLLEGGAR